LDRSGVAIAVADAIEAASFDRILTGAAVLFGHAGIAACKADAGRMRWRSSCS